MKLISSITIVSSIAATSMAANIRGRHFVDTNAQNLGSFGGASNEVLTMEAIEDQIIADQIAGWQDAQWDFFFEELDELVTEYEIANGIINDPYVNFDFANTGLFAKRR